MTIVDLYYYWFYKFYKALQSCWFTKGGDTKYKAGALIIILELWLMFSILFYCEFFFKIKFNFNFLSSPLLIPIIVIYVVKLIAFVRNDNWKNYVNKFDQWTKEKNQKGTWIVVGVVIFIIVNFIVSVNLIKGHN